MADSFIKFNNVTFSYTVDEETGQKIKPALRNVSFEINRGEFVAILGHNGSGKSTAAKMMNGLAVPDEGEVTVDGIPTSDEKRIIDIRKKVGMVFQNPDNQIIGQIVEEDVGFGPENMGVPSEEIWDRVYESLRAVVCGVFFNETVAFQGIMEGIVQGINDFVVEIT